MRTQPMGSNSPPHARLAFRVGIVGHRPDRLPKDQRTLDALQRMLKHVLEVVKMEVSAFAEGDKANLSPAYSDDQPILRAISSLAEGADRMFAGEAIDLGYALFCPMPFLLEDFEKDFLLPRALHENSLERFHELLALARDGAGGVTYELDGQHLAAGEAYGMAGRVVLNQSDLLIVVWDGGKPAGSGGTVQTIHEAVHYRVPVLWINAVRPKAWQLLLTEDDVNLAETTEVSEPDDSQELMKEQIKKIVAAELEPPGPLSGRSHATALSAREYFAECRPRWNVWFAWKIFRDFLGSRELKFPEIVVSDFESQISEDWPIQYEHGRSSDAISDPSLDRDRSSPSPMEDWVNRHLRPHYAWADKLADWYADHYRSAYLSIYILAAVAVLIALVLPEVWQGALFESILVGTIVLLVWRGSRRHWHERWMEYRLLAELIRQIRTLIPLGGGRPLPSTPIHLGGYENLTQTWMYWHMRAVARATGLPPAKVTAEYLRNCLEYMAKLVGGQLDFHKKTLTRSKVMAELLHPMASELFLISLCYVLIRLTILATNHFVPDITHAVIEGLGLVLSGTVFVVASFFWLFYRSGGVFLAAAAILFASIAAAWFFSHPVIDLFLGLAALPAFGAAFTGIANQGEFARLEKRSIAMADAFEHFADRIADLQQKKVGQPQLSSCRRSLCWRLRSPRPWWTKFPTGVFSWPSNLRDCNSGDDYAELVIGTASKRAVRTCATAITIGRAASLDEFYRGAAEKQLRS